MTIAGLVAFGVLTGVAAGVLGVGGGVMMVPFLVLVIGYSQHEAEATSLLVVLPTAVVASVVLYRRGVGIRWRSGSERWARSAASSERARRSRSPRAPSDSCSRRSWRSSACAWCATRYGASGDYTALVDRLAAAIEARVVSGDIPTGSRLRQETLASEFPAFRERRSTRRCKLQAAGRAGRAEPGAIVRGPTAREVREAYEVRAELEGLAAELAATRIRDAELRRLHDAQGLFHRSMTTLLAWKRGADGEGAPPSAAHDEWIHGNNLFYWRSRTRQATSACARPSPTSTSASRAT